MLLKVLQQIYLRFQPYGNFYFVPKQKKKKTLCNLLINDIFGKPVSIYGSSVVQKEHIFLMQIQIQKEENLNKMSSSIEEEAYQIAYNSTKFYMTKVTKIFTERT